MKNQYIGITWVVCRWMWRTIKNSKMYKKAHTLGASWGFG